MNTSRIIEHIAEWLKSYSDQSGTNGFVIGISGGIDSAVTSTLCAATGKKVICVNMPIHQKKAEYDRGNEHIQWLRENYPNVSSIEVSLTEAFEGLRNTLPEEVSSQWLAMANTRARLRMTTLYAIAQSYNLLVAGTGNKVEDFGVGFFTKYGDGGVDLSPIADLMKTEVYRLGKELGIVTSILSARPTDGLWEDGRSDEDQIGATYPELEWAMTFIEANYPGEKVPHSVHEHLLEKIKDRQREVLRIFLRLHNANRHKMNAIPVCRIPEELK
jgi:NAD+ synthase